MPKKIKTAIRKNTPAVSEFDTKDDVFKYTDVCLRVFFELNGSNPQLALSHSSADVIRVQLREAIMRAIALGQLRLPSLEIKLINICLDPPTRGTETD